ncbi:gas vesicle protein K [Algihabitans albus]|uniref:gas vesicle protein K n=1 Tax=Algihabitans albus TaxID=2164067 RepID=UPI000E5C9B0A|nr:gas vesicle protein K [Algihabitans albus]
MTDWAPADKLLWAPERDEALDAASEALSESVTQPSRIDLDPDSVDRGLTKLVLSIVDLIRQLLERQALRRVEAGHLGDADVERLGETLMRLDQRMQELKKAFDLTDADLRLDLGSIQDLEAENQAESQAK